MMPLPVHELSIPAMLLAGLALSPHCALMCGPVQTLQLRGAPASISPLLWLHLGRVLGYALMGAAAGYLGARLMLWLPAREFSGWLQALAGAGALLMAAFGVGTVPLLAGGGQALQGLLRAPTLRRLTAVLLVSLGAAALGAVLAPQHFAPWCLPAQAMEHEFFKNIRNS